MGSQNCGIFLKNSVGEERVRSIFHHEGAKEHEVSAEISFYVVFPVRLRSELALSLSNGASFVALSALRGLIYRTGFCWGGRSRRRLDLSLYCRQHGRFPAQATSIRNPESTISLCPRCAPSTWLWTTSVAPKSAFIGVHLRFQFRVRSRLAGSGRADGLKKLVPI